MDETEVQVEIACWAQQHPEAERINWQGGNEPWVSFPGILCTLHIGLGGLVWSIGVPVGYQTELTHTDGSRKRCWDPFDFHDTVIVPDRNTPFRVSVLYPKNSVVEESRFLVQQPGYDYQDAQDSVINLLKQLQVSDENSDSAGNQEQQLLIRSKACLQAMNKAETLSEVLDAIHALTTFPRSSLSTCADPVELHSMYSMGCQSNVSNECEDDLFGPELAYNWSWIKTQVEYAADACRTARNCTESGVTDPKRSNEPQVVRMVEEMEGLEITDIITVTSGSQMLVDFDCESSPRTDDYAYIRGTSSNRSSGYTDTLNGIRSISRSKSDSDLSVNTDESWEDVADMSEGFDSKFLNDSEETVIQARLPSNNKRKFQQVFPPGGVGGEAQPAGAGVTLTEDILPGSSGSATCDDEVPEDRFGGPENLLQYCDISFNAASFSVECTINLDRFMQNNTGALMAMGLFLEHPLRVEIVPNKEHVDALVWTGMVEVYVTQQSEWHNHVSEEVCGLLCFVPHILRHYFEGNGFGELRHPPTPDRRGDLFIGVLEMVVRRLAHVSRDNCCVCARPLDERSRTFEDRIMWPCDDNICQALYASWQAESSYDAEERVRHERASLALVEKDLREDFPYSEYILDNLKCALDVYNVDCNGLNYGQMIRALAQIELWNRRDLDQFS